MPRRPRNREPCFFAEEDHHVYLHWMEKAAADWHCAIHAYVLMTNHVHLLLTPDNETGLAKLMQAVGRRYVQYINRSYRRTGSLWDPRKPPLVYKALVALKAMQLEMGGERFALSAGMQSNAEILLGTRTVMEYLLSPVRKAWHEAGRER